MLTSTLASFASRLQRAFGVPAVSCAPALAHRSEAFGLYPSPRLPETGACFPADVAIGVSLLPGELPVPFAISTDTPGSPSRLGFGFWEREGGGTAGGGTVRGGEGAAGGRCRQRETGAAFPKRTGAAAGGTRPVTPCCRHHGPALQAATGGGPIWVVLFGFKKLFEKGINGNR